MAGRIHILPEILCNQIAAGEVVERPASVVKELVENALDAEAGEIVVEIEAGGRKLIRVADDGCGMGRDDLFLCVERHATSKIGSERDLFSISTLGFRGEALPSIAAVSRTTLRSADNERGEGYEIQIEGGTVRRTGALGMTRGTTIEVRDLFFNLPARRKFLRKEETELGHIAETVTRLALAAPEVRFRLLHNGRSLFDLPRHVRLEERIVALLGREILGDLVKVRADGADGTTLHGVLSRPDCHRASTATIYTYINGRFIRDRVVQHAILDGYRHLLPRGRYPVALLFLALDPAQVDVNVHPTKHEVRFREQSAIHDFIAETVRNAFRRNDATASPGAAQEGQGVAAPTPLAERQSTLPGVAPSSWRICDPPAPRFAAPPLPAATVSSSPFVMAAVPPVQSVAAESDVVPAATGFRALRVIGQLLRSYIVAEDGEGLVLIDQHAAHERIGFERLRREWQRGGIEQQSLLFPPLLECDFREAAHLREHLEQLDRLGFAVEDFGGRTFAVKAVPRLLQGADPVRLLRDVAADLVGRGRSVRIEESVEELLVSMSCHGMVRANHDLSPPEIEALLGELDSVDFNAHCPHGRPIVARLAPTEIARMFRR